MSSCSGESEGSAASPQGSQMCLDNSSRSPPQLVPQGSCPLTELLHSVGISSDDDYIETPFLKIIEQPQKHYKFRYKSEMENSHGCLYGKSYETDKTLPKTYPEVELFNYNGKATIKCELVQVNNTFEHPHKLCVSDEENITVAVPEKNNYKVRFRGMCIIHTARQDVTDWLQRAYDVENTNSEEKKSLKKRCENLAKLINLNSVRLKFSAVDVDSNVEICDPVYSDPIQNLKSPATNILKICRMSRTCTRVSGGDDVIMLVEKVVKKNIKIRFFEMSEEGIEKWSEWGIFSESEVHHQYAIVFRTPRYENPHITKRVKVWVELVRPTDGQKSEPKEFYYTPDPFSNLHMAKKRKISFTDHIATQQINNTSNNRTLNLTLLRNRRRIAAGNNTQVPVVCNTTNSMLPQHDISSFEVPATKSQQLALGQYAVNPQNVHETKGPMLSQGLEPVAPAAHDSASHANHIIGIDDDDITQFLDKFSDFINSPSDLFPQIDDLPYESPIQLEMDCGPHKSQDRVYRRNKNRAIDLSILQTVTPQMMTDVDDEVYDNFTRKKMARELQTLVKMMRVVNPDKNDTLIKKIEGLFEIRLSNGDTFLHQIVTSKQPLLHYIISLIHDSNMSHLLNLRNISMQTILHLAVFNNLPDLIPILLSKGCDPMLEDIEGNNVIHYAVMYQDCLEPLLDAIKKLNITHDLDACNYERQTALHFAVIYKSEFSVRKLIENGASYNARDSEGRTPLHLAAYDDCLHALAELLRRASPKDVDEVDGRGYTALQIICDQEMRDGSLEIIKLLLDKNAEPLKKHEYHDTTAWGLVKDKPQARELMRKFLPENTEPSDVSDDEFESADEGEISDGEALAGLTKPMQRLTITTASEARVSSG